MDNLIKNNFIKVIFLIPLGFLFLLAFYIPNTKVPVYDIIIPIGFIAAFIVFPKKIIKILVDLSKYQHFQCLILFLIWIIFIGILFTILGTYSLSHFIYATFLLFFYNNYTWYLYPAILAPNILSEKKIIRFLYIAIYAICVYGLFSFFLNLVNLGFLDVFQMIINNRREVLSTKRVISVFEEPSHMGGFLCVVLPFVYTISLSKYKIFNDNNFNALIKKSFIPLVILTICCVQSPIWLVFFAIISAVYFSKNIIRFIKKHIVQNIIVAAVLVLILFTTNLPSVNLSGTYLNRISIVLTSFSNWEKLVLFEPSLANRLLSYGSRFRLWLDYPITGVGYKNAEYNISEVLTNKLKITLTREMKESISNSKLKSDYVVLNGSILWILLSDTGIVGFILFYLFIIFSILKLNRITSYLPNGLQKDYINAVKYTYINIICLSIYGTNINTIYIWFFLGLTNVFVLYGNKYLIVKKNEISE